MCSVAPVQRGRGVPLADALGDVISGRPGIFGIYARNLRTGETVAINADVVLPAESAAKTFVLVHYARLVSSEGVDPAARVRLDGSARYPGTGVLRYLADGLEPTLDDLAWLMIVVSDNTATAMLIASIGGPGAVNATMRELGYPTAQLNESITFEDALKGQPFSTSSPRDLAEVYTQLDDRCRAILFRNSTSSACPDGCLTQRSLPTSASRCPCASTTRPATGWATSSTRDSSRPTRRPGSWPRWPQSRPTSPVEPMTAHRSRSERSARSSTKAGHRADLELSIESSRPRQRMRQLRSLPSGCRRSGVTGHRIARSGIAMIPARP
jgi:hypothetical protein